MENFGRSECQVLRIFENLCERHKACSCSVLFFKFSFCSWVILYFLGIRDISVVRLFGESRVFGHSIGLNGDGWRCYLGGWGCLEMFGWALVDEGVIWVSGSGFGCYLVGWARVKMLFWWVGVGRDVISMSGDGCVSDFTADVFFILQKRSFLVEHIHSKRYSERQKY